MKLNRPLTEIVNGCLGVLTAFRTPEENPEPNETILSFVRRTLAYLGVAVSGSYQDPLSTQS